MDLTALPPTTRHPVAAALAASFALLDRARLAAAALVREGSLGHGPGVASAVDALAAALAETPTRASISASFGDDAWSPSPEAWLLAAERAGAAASTLLRAAAAVAAARERDLLLDAETALGAA